MKIMSLATLLICTLLSTATPREGLWIPLLLGDHNIAEMHEMGCALTSEEIYSINKGSLKDAIVRFGGGCTSSIISAEGLLLTNHHCGYSQIQSHSSVDNDLLSDGFWAGSRPDELMNNGLTATLIVRIEDVTEQVLDGLKEGATEHEREIHVGLRSREIEQTAIGDSHYGAQVSAYFGGNTYYLTVTETFRDIRLVGAPPSSIGKFGGDLDNWIWPRHTGDFALFRIYAGPDNKPAAYSEENVPYRPKHFLPVSMAGVRQNEFTMVFGFPGTTKEYTTSHGIDWYQNEAYPKRVAIRSSILDIMNRYMAENDTVRIKYAAKQSRVSNAWKKWQGEIRGLRILNAVKEKRKGEEAFQRWTASHPEYSTLLADADLAYQDGRAFLAHQDILNEAFFNAEILLFAFRFERYVTRALQPQDERYVADSATLQQLQNRVNGFFKNYHRPLDREKCEAMLTYYFRDVPVELRPEHLRGKGGSPDDMARKWTNLIFDKSMLLRQEKLKSTFARFDAKVAKKLMKDPAYQLAVSVVNHYRAEVAPKVRSTQRKLDSLDRVYQKALHLMHPDKTFYPDANSTLRLSYGKVDGYTPRDAVRYNYLTTMDGMIDKHATGEADYDIPSRMAELYAKGNFGRYGFNGKLPICFVASNHTTGGNSGSPVLNGKGELVGLNFDRTWESTMSDFVYDKEICRNISVDVRYILWVIDVFAEADHLLDELLIQ